MQTYDINDEALAAYRQLSPEEQRKVDTLVLQSTEHLIASAAANLPQDTSLAIARDVIPYLDKAQEVNRQRAVVVQTLGSERPLGFDLNRLQASLRDIVVDSRVLDGIQASDISIPNIMRSSQINTNRPAH